MSNILIISPIYKIEGRNELFQDSSAVHYLVKYWKQYANVYVIVNYINGLSRLKRYFAWKQLKYYFSGYHYNCDKIPVTLIERQNVIMNQQNGLWLNSLRYKKIIYKTLQSNSFVPDKIIVHLPSTSKFFVKNLSYQCEKIAVLHYTDIKYLKKHRKSFLKYLESTFTRVYCRSKSIYAIFLQEGLKNLKSEIIYSGVNIADHQLETLSVSNDNTFHVLYVGKLIRRKNLDVLIRALSNISISWSLEVIGEGPCKEEWVRLVHELNLESQVKFLGTFTHDQIFEYMRRADIFCMPSINETLGLVYLEAMSQGCITIGTQNEGIDGIIIHGKNGFLTQPNVIELQKLLQSIMSLSAFERQKIVDEGLQTARTFDEEKMSKKYYNIVMEDN